MVSLFLLLGFNLSYIFDLFAALHGLASASARTLPKLASSVRALLKPYGATLNQGFTCRFGLRVNCGRHVARLHHRRRRRRRRRAYAPTSNTASHDTHEKISSWVPFSFLIWVWGSAWRPSAAGAPLLASSQTCHEK